MKELSEYLDEAVDPATRAHLEAHMSECPNCWVVCDTTRKTIRIYKGMEPEPVPADVERRLLEAIERKAARKAE